MAAIRQRNAAWARALLQTGGDLAGARAIAGMPWAADYQLAAALPPRERAERAAALLAAAARRLGRPRPAGPDAAADAAIPEVANFPGPWPDVLAEAFVAMLARTVSPAPPASRAGWPRELMLTAARNLPATGPADYAARLTQLAGAPDCPAPWAAVLRRTAQTIAARRAFYEEIR